MHIKIFEIYNAVLPITSVVIEVAQFDTQVLKAVQNGAALNGFLRVGYNGFRFGGSRDRADRYNRSNHAQRKKDACQFFGETHRITP